MIKDAQMTLIGAAIGLAGMLAVHGGMPADAAKPSIIRDMCKNMSGGDGGLQCRGSDYLLIRSKDALGFCGAWKCCPPNGDGTYDCSRAETPTRLIRDRVGGVVGTRPGTGRSRPAADAIARRAETGCGEPELGARRSIRFRGDSGGRVEPPAS